MTPKEKCDDLIEKFRNFVGKDNILYSLEIINAKSCALICVEELKSQCDYDGDENYWEAVKQEIELL